MKYWGSGDFERLQAAPPGKLYSKGPIPWRLLAYLLKVSPEIDKVRSVVRKRLTDEARACASEKILDRMLLTLERDGFVTLDPPSPAGQVSNLPVEPGKLETCPTEDYLVRSATPTPALDNLLVFRSIHPLYGAFLLQHIGLANRDERIQALESVLEMPRPLLKFVRVPFPDQLPPGPLATERLDPDLIQRGLIAAAGRKGSERGRGRRRLARSAADSGRQAAAAVRRHAPRCGGTSRRNRSGRAGELLRFAGNFNLFVKSRDLVKQEGIVFRHLLRLILLCGEFAEVCPRDTTPEEWKGLPGQLLGAANGELPRGRSDQYRPDDPARPCRRRGGG